MPSRTASASLSSRRYWERCLATKVPSSRTSARVSCALFSTGDRDEGGKRPGRHELVGTIGRRDDFPLQRVRPRRRPERRADVHVDLDAARASTSRRATRATLLSVRAGDSAVVEQARRECPTVFWAAARSHMIFPADFREMPRQTVLPLSPPPTPPRAHHRARTTLRSRDDGDKSSAPTHRARASRRARRGPSNAPRLAV